MAQVPVPGSGRDDVPSGAAREPAGGPRIGVAARAAGGYAAFEQGRALDGEVASAALAVVLDELAGADRHPAAASDDAVLGMLAGFDKLAGWIEAGRLGLVREMIRRRPQPGFEGRGPGGLPGAWQDGLTQEIAAELAISAPAADKLLTTAYALARLPGTAAALDAGVISGLKASIIAEVTGPLEDAQAAEADRRAAPKLPGKTPGQVRDLIRRIVIAVDPDGARRRREQAQRESARVEFWQDEINGTANLAGFCLPTDEALIANQRIQDRALAYKRAKIFPGAPMDLLRVRAYIDLLLGRDARDTTPAESEDDSPAADGSPAAGGPMDGKLADGPANSDPAPAPGPAARCGAAGGTGTWAAASGGGTSGQDGTGGEGEPSGNSGRPPGTGRDQDNTPARGEPRAGEPRAGGPPPGGAPPGGAQAGTGSGGGPGLAANVNLTIPLATLLGLADRPGYLAGLGPIDPALARDMTAAAARSGRSAWCVTVTNQDGHAIGHGCARPARSKGGKPGHPGHPDRPGTRDGPGPRDGPAFTPMGDGPDGGYGTWRLTTPSGQDYTVSLGPIPVTDCDHRYESAGYQPSALLRHLVQVRDGTCTFPPCRRPARTCDFEHAVPYHLGGRTDLCNCGPRCRRDHQVKQSQGWSVTQDQPGYHQWRTPAGRRYTSGPTEHPT